MTYTNDAIQRPSSTRNIVKKIVAQPYTSLVLLGSLLLSAASFFTTFSGMIDFTEVWIVNFCVVFAIQGLLFVTSWRIGFAVAERERLPIFTVFVFLICLATSVFFSFAALNDYVNDEDTRERKRVERMHAAVDGTNGAIAQSLANGRIAEIDALLATPTFAGWERQLDEVAETALSARAIISEARDAAAEEISVDIARLEAEQQAIRRESAASSARIGTLQERLAALQQERPEIVALIATLRGEVRGLNQEIALKEGEMRAEEDGSISGGGAGRGPAWRDLRDQRNILAAQRDAKERALLDAQARLEQLDTDIADVSADIAIADGSAGDSRVAALDARIEELRGRLGDSGGGRSLAADVDTMKAALAAFKSRQQPDLADLDRTIALCGTVISELRANPTLRGAAAELSCEPAPELATIVSRARRAIDQEAAFIAACSRGGAQPPLSSLGFTEAANFGLGCIETFARADAMTVDGQTTTFQEQLRQAIVRVSQDENPNTTRYERAVSEFMLSDKLAYSAAAIALFIDVLVLFSGLIGALSSSGKLQLALGRILTKGEIEDFERALSPNVARFVLGHQRALEKTDKVTSGKISGLGGRRLVYSALIDIGDEDVDPRMRAQARAFLIAQKSKGLVSTSPSGAVVARSNWRGRGESAFASGVSDKMTSDEFWLSDELMRALRAYLESPESHRLSGLPRTGAMTEDDRRRAAQNIRRLARPYRSAWWRLGDWSYVARVKLANIDKDVPKDSDSKPREDAMQVMVALYSEGLAKPERFNRRNVEESTIYLVKDLAIELLDRAGKLTEAEEEAARQEAAERAREEQLRAEERERQRRIVERTRQMPRSPDAALPPPADDYEADTVDLTPTTETPERFSRDEPSPRRVPPFTGGEGRSRAADRGDLAEEQRRARERSRRAISDEGSADYGALAGKAEEVGLGDTFRQRREQARRRRGN